MGVNIIFVMILPRGAAPDVEDIAEEEAAYVSMAAYCFSNWNEQGRPSTRVPVPIAPLKCASML